MKILLRIINISLFIFLLYSCKKDKIPAVKTNAIINITGITATSGGTIISEGTEDVISRGICWSTAANPTIADSKTKDGVGAGAFTSNISGLNGATIYYVRAYATNMIGTGYGMSISFTTLGESPSLTNSGAKNITTSGATINGAANPNYFSTAVIFEYGTTTSYGLSVTADQSPITGNLKSDVSANITSLTAGSTYHYRLKAINSVGTEYSHDTTFITLGKSPTSTNRGAKNINAFGASINGSVNPNYLSTSVIFEYGTTTSYGLSVTASQSPLSGNTKMDVNGNISGLTAATLYHYRVKAINSVGMTYSSDTTFITLGDSPTSTNTGAKIINTSRATITGLVNPNYLSTTVTFEYGLTTSYDFFTTATQSPISGNVKMDVSANITGLTAGTTYHYRVKAINSVGTAYSRDTIFSTTTGVTDYDGNIYNTVIIGTRTWMAENLKTIHYNDGSSIPYAGSGSSWVGATGGGYCIFNDQSSYSTIYGALYNWATVNTGKLCPTGWHVPTSTEWLALTDNLGGTSVAGGTMKEVGYTHWSNPNGGANNSSGFTALGASYIDYNGVFGVLGLTAYYWSSTEVSTTNAFANKLFYDNSTISQGGLVQKISGYSIRCIKD